MTSVKDIYAFLCGIAPLELQMGFDNSGLLLGHCESQVKKALLSLDVSSEVAKEAKEMKADLIVSHHPVIFNAVKSITDGDPEGAKLLMLAESRIAVISMHTNLDIADGGVNDVLIEALGAKAEEPLDSDNCGRIGTMLKPLSMKDFLPLCKNALDTDYLRYYDCGKEVSRLAVMGGAGGSALYDAYEKGCDTYVTADIKYHQFLEAKELGINLIDGDHYGTENLVIPVLKEKLQQNFPSVDFVISRKNKQTAALF